jgi:phosphoserine/homoserine phosphotransferase
LKAVCLDLEGVLVPEIWIAFAEETGIPEFKRTTRDEPDYDKLMRYRIDLLDKHNLKLPDIQRVISNVKPLPGAAEFAAELREKTQLIILSDTFEEFAKPLMMQLEWPTIFCNSITAASDGVITGYTLRQQNGKKKAVEALQSINIQVFAAGDSFNDLAMIQQANAGCLFRAPQSIIDSHPDIGAVDTYPALLGRIEEFLL